MTQHISGGYDQYTCPVEGCPWSCAWPCFGFCVVAPVLAAPLAAVQAIGEHATWHKRPDVRSGRVVVRWDEGAQDFVERTVTE